LSKQIEHIIHNKEELKNLLSNHTLSFLPREGNIRLLFDHLSENEKLNWEKKLSKYFFECGCGIAAKSTIIFLLFYLIYLFAFTDMNNLLRWQTIAYGFAFVILGALTGKIFGLLFYRYLLHRSVNKLLKRSGN
jgi:hypothetical protein